MASISGLPSSTASSEQSAADTEAREASGLSPSRGPTVHGVSRGLPTLSWSQP